MLIKNIWVENYRNFLSLQFKLDEKCTIITGLNGSGKTNLITAICCVLSMFFDKELGLNKNNDNEPFSLNEYDFYKYNPFKNNSGVIVIGAIFEIKGENVNLTLNTKLEYREKILNKWLMNEKQITITQTIDNKNTFMSKIKELDQLPLIAYYTPQFPMNDITINKKIKSLETNKNQLPSDFSYYACIRDNLNNELPIKVWLDRFINSCVNNSNQEELLYVKNKLIEFSISSGDFKINQFNLVLRNIDVYQNKFTNKRETDILFIFFNGSVSTYNNLPSGFKRLFSIVIDLAYRNYTLNNGNDNVNGFVLIDNIEIHLDEKLQVNLLDRFKKLFPNVQFVYTTCSKLITNQYPKKTLFI